MKVYNVKYTTDLKNMIGADEVQALEMEPLDEHPETFVFQICALDYRQANEIAYGMIEEVLGEGKEYEIEGIDLVDGVFISNWSMDLEEEEHDEHSCPFCGIQFIPPDDCLNFECSCGEKISVIPEGWETIQCPNEKCGNIIKRTSVIDVNGKWVLRQNDLEEDKK